MGFGIKKEHFLFSSRSDAQKVVSKRKITVASDDNVVSATVAKKDWFLKSSDLARLPHAGGGAAWGVGRFATKYSTQDLDSLALRIHGVVGLARLFFHVKSCP